MQSVNRLRPGNEISLQAQLSIMIAEKQQQISTGRRIESPSQDPASWSQISGVAKQQANVSAWLKNIERGIAIAGQAEKTIEEFSNQLLRAKELLVQASNGTQSFENRALIAVEIIAISESINQLTDTKDGFGDLLFADGEPLKMPIDENLQIAVVPSRSSLTASVAFLNDVAEVIRFGDPNTMLPGMEDAINQISQSVGSQGILSKRLEQAENHLRERQIDLSSYRSSLEDADITQSIASMQKLLLNLQAAQATYAQIEQTTLFDLIR